MKKRLEIVREIDEIRSDCNDESEVLRELKMRMLSKISPEPLLGNKLREVKDFVSMFPLTSIYFISMVVAAIQAIVVGGSVRELLNLLPYLLLLIVLCMLADIVLQRLLQWIERKVRTFLDGRLNEKLLHRDREAVQESRNVLRGIITAAKSQLSSLNDQVAIDRKAMKDSMNLRDELKSKRIVDDPTRLRLIYLRAEANAQIFRSKEMIAGLDAQIETCEKMVEFIPDISEASNLLGDLRYLQELFREAKRLVELDRAIVESMVENLNMLLEVQDVKLWDPDAEHALDEQIAAPRI